MAKNDLRLRRGIIKIAPECLAGLFVDRAETYKVFCQSGLSEVAILGVRAFNPLLDEYIEIGIQSPDLEPVPINTMIPDTNIIFQRVENEAGGENG